MYSSEGEQGQGPEWEPGLRDPSWRLAGTEDGALLAGVWVTALGLLDIVVVIAVDIPASAPYVLARLERQPTQRDLDGDPRPLGANLLGQSFIARS